MANKYDRLFVACVTPFKPGTEDIDLGECRSLFRHWGAPRWINAGGSIIVNPEAGESFYTTIEEKCEIARVALEELGDKTIVFSGAMQPTTKALVEEAKALKKVGVHGLFLTPPMGSMDITQKWNPNEFPEVWIDQLKEVEDAVDLPVITHPTGGMFYGMPVPAMLKILEAIPQIVGWKLISAHWRETCKALRGFESNRHVATLIAGATQFHEAFAYGYFDGSVSGNWNYSMEPMLDLVEAWKKDDVVKARKILFDGLIQLHDAVEQDDFESGYRLHSAMKATTWLNGLISAPFMRAPVRKLRTGEVRLLRDRLKNCHLEVISDKAIQQYYPDF